MSLTSETRLLNIARKLRDLAQDIEDLSVSLSQPKEEKNSRARARDIPIDSVLIERLKGLGRAEASQELSTLGHKQLGSIVRALGGSSDEAKKSKEVLSERILYRLFDYAAGHKLLKGETDPEIEAKS
ncbi:MAG: hypothetical protein BWX92_02314 [Deltaproteobacteria bacterium ADurb.Bin135]|nr:MAG: hypothetical protein BWX92_02314 [Deltaproteobacteria bacterium ADurb.Bin135]